MSKILKAIGTNTILLAFFALSQVVFEYMLALWASTHDYENYIFSKNLLVTLCALSTFGATDLIVRYSNTDTNKIEKLSRYAFACNIIVCILCGLFSELILPNQSLTYKGLVIFTLFLFGWGQIISSVYRSSKKFNQALFLRDGWRAFLWLSLIFIYFVDNYSKGIMVSFILMYGILVITYLVGKWKNNSIVIKDYFLISNLLPCQHDLKLSFSFWVSGLSLVSASYLDQLFLGYLSHVPGELKQYSLSVLFTVTPFLLLSTSVGYILMPSIASIDNHSFKEVENRILGKGKILLVIALSCSVLYFFAVKYIMSFVKVEMTFGLFITLFFVGLLRLAWSIPSSILGALGSHRQINYFTLMGIVSILIQVVTTYYLYNFISLLGIALSTLLMWALRLSVGGYMSFKILKTKLA